MTAGHVATLRCDGPDCHQQAWRNTWTYTVPQLRVFMQIRHGWAYRDRKDWCRACAYKAGIAPKQTAGAS